MSGYHRRYTWQDIKYEGIDTVELGKHLWKHKNTESKTAEVNEKEDNDNIFEKCTQNI